MDEILTLPDGYDRSKNPAMLRFRNMTKSEILALSYGERVWFLANDGKARMLKINGRVKTWVRDADRFEVPIKYGMYEYGTFSAREALARFLMPAGE